MKGLKWFIFSLIGFVSLIGFSYGIDYTNGFVEYNGQFFDPSVNSGYFCLYIGGDFQSWDLPQGTVSYGFNCTSLNNCSNWGQYTYYTYKSCIILSGYEIINLSVGTPSDGTVYYSFTPFPSECEVCQECSVVDTGIIGSGNWSALYINDIQHESSPLINLTIPDEFDWDYINENDEFDLWISGYNVDTAYIDGIIRKQTTLPNKTDFNNTISGLIPLFVPGLVIIAVLYFIFRFIKKVF